MKFDRLRKALVRLIEPAATSVSPRSEWKHTSMVGPHYIPPTVKWSMSADIESWAPSADTGRAIFEPEAASVPRETLERDVGIKPPLDAGGDGWTWERWSATLADLSAAGWSPCRLAHRSSPRDQPEKAVFVYGVVRGAFGMWQQSFDVYTSVDGDVPEKGRDALTVVTHLRSGLGMGIFGVTSDAAQAASIAEQVCPDWPSIDYDSNRQTFANAMQRTLDAWRAFGIHPAANAQAFDPSTSSGPYFIMGLSLESAAEGKPEKPS